MEGTTEVIFYEPMTSGRSELEAACRAKGLSWGVINYRVTAQGNGASKIRATILVGTVYEVDAEGDNLDPLLLQLAEAITDGDT